MTLDEPDGQTKLRLAFFGNVNSIHVHRWVGYFAARGHEVLLLAPVNAAIAPGLPDNIRVERFWPFSPRGHFPPLSYLRARRSIRSRLAAFRPDLVNAHYLTHNGWHAWMSGRHPYVLTTWGSDVFFGPHSARINGWLARRTLGAADMIMVNSEALRRGVIGLGGGAEKTRLIQWGVDLERFKPGPASEELRSRLGLAGRRMVFSPRSMSPIYRQDVVVKALTRLPPDVHLVMLSGRSQASEVQAVRELVDSLSLGDRVTLLDHVQDSEMPDLLRTADVVVSVPLSDSTSASILESLASGCQIVASDLPSVREWLGDLEPSNLVPVGDVEATAEALARAMDRDPAERARLAQAARRIVEDRADEKLCFAEIERLFVSLVAGSGSSDPRTRQRIAEPEGRR